MRVALIEDNPDLRGLISQNLEKAGIHVDAAEDGDAALNLIDPEIHNLIVLDRGLPDMEGLELLKILREEHVKTPVLILTAKDALGDKIDGLNSGADDYLVKPFEMDELIARIHALNRRPSNIVDTVLKIGNVSFSPSSNTLNVNGKDLEISAKEKDALESLIRLPGRVVSKEALQNTIYGHSEEGSTNSVEVIIHRLRKKMKMAKADVEIRNLRGIGYLLKQIESDT